jgi:hypothetical protein
MTGATTTNSANHWQPPGAPTEVRSNPTTGYRFRATTNWVVSPFQTVIGRPPTWTGGFFDWPALVALIVVALLSLLLLGLLRPRTDY